MSTVLYKEEKVMIKKSSGEKIFSVFNYIILTLLAVTTLYPLLYTFTISMSTSAEASRVGLHILPKPGKMTLNAYIMVFSNSEIWTAYGYTIFRTIVGTVLSVLVTILYGYALSRPNLPMKRFFSIYLLITMFFHAGQIPSYLNIKSLGLINNVWVYILPGLISAYNVVISKSFFVNIPESLNESARIDGASEFRTFFQIIIPLSKAIIMTLALWIAVGHWNAWLDALLYMTDASKVTVQMYLQRIMEGNTSLLSNGMEASKTQEIVPITIQSASIIVSVVPILCFYPFVQKYFATGVTLGAVKG